MEPNVDQTKAVLALLESYSEKFKVPLVTIKRVFSAKSEETRTLLDGFTSLNVFLSQEKLSFRTKIETIKGNIYINTVPNISEEAKILAFSSLKEFNLDPNLLICELYLESSNSFLDRLEIII